MVKDMTNGSPSRHILGFAVPMLFGMLFQQFYNLVDTIIVGKTLGVEALAGVGATGSINFMIIGFCMGVCNGFTFDSWKYLFMKGKIWMPFLISVSSTVLGVAIALLLNVLMAYPLSKTEFCPVSKIISVLVHLI